MGAEEVWARLEQTRDSLPKDMPRGANDLFK